MDGHQSRRDRGHHAEGVAARYLESKGVVILERNVYNRGGELDLVGRDGETLVFFEVRFRSEGSLTGGAESVTWSKQQKLVRAVSFYLYRNGLWDAAARIDVIAIAPGHKARYQIQWIKNAIQASP